LIYPEIGLAVLSSAGPIRPEKALSATSPDDVVRAVYFFNPIYLEQVFSDFSIDNLIDPDLFKSGLAGLARVWRGGADRITIIHLICGFDKLNFTCTPAPCTLT
jgi:hypothetical protein